MVYFIIKPGKTVFTLSSPFSIIPPGLGRSYFISLKSVVIIGRVLCPMVLAKVFHPLLSDSFRFSMSLTCVHNSAFPQAFSENKGRLKKHFSGH